MPTQKPYDSFYISTLLGKMLNGKLTEAEQQELDLWREAHPENNAVISKLSDVHLRAKDMKAMNAIDTEGALKTMLARINENENYQPGRKKHFGTWFKVAASAAVVILMATGVMQYNKQPQRLVTETAMVKKQAPDPNTILLTLSNGTTIDLQNAKNGAIAHQGNVMISKTSSGAIDYHTAATGVEQINSSEAYNTLSIPRGKQYQVVLPDGTRVWLNAQSSLKYPVAFNKNERIVELSGEAYFEVNHITNQPFHVKSDDQVVQVLGTQFNIESYPEEEKTTTTLAQGAVRVSKGTVQTVLKPGQMTVNARGSGKLTPLTANIADALAWKNGYFSFSDERIEDLMRRVTRYYDMEVEYQGNVKDKKFWGSYPHSNGLIKLLKNLEQTETIHFKVDGKKIIVTP